MKSSFKDFLHKIDFNDPSEYDFDADEAIDVNIKETIKNRGNNVENQAFTQIICFVNNDNTMFTNYFKTELKKKSIIIFL